MFNNRSFKFDENIIYPKKSPSSKQNKKIHYKVRCYTKGAYFSTCYFRYEITDIGIHSIFHIKIIKNKILLVEKYDHTFTNKSISNKRSFLNMANNNLEKLLFIAIEKWEKEGINSNPVKFLRVDKNKPYIITEYIRNAENAQIK